MHGMWGGDEREMVYWCVIVWVLGVDDEHGNWCWMIRGWHA